MQFLCATKAQTRSNIFDNPNGAAPGRRLLSESSLSQRDQGKGTNSLQAEETQLPQLLLTRQVLQPCDHLGNPPLKSVQLLMSVLFWGGSSYFC